MNFSFDSLTLALTDAHIAPLVLVLLLAASTLVSEDLTCIAAGMLAAHGRTSFVVAVAGCLLGIFAGDLLLFLAGRFVGRAALRRAPLKWFVRASAVERSSAWFRRKGSVAILLSRFLPGTRLPTYFAAGLLDTSLWTFALYFLAAAALWTPALVGLSLFVGAETIKSSLMFGQSVVLKTLLAGLFILLVVKLSLRVLSYRGRRLLLGRLRRIARWEFWPVWAFYPPVVAYIALLALKHRSLTVFTCANPAIPGGGFIGESKFAILQGLSATPAAREHIARAELLPASLTHAARLNRARDFMATHELTLPVVLKPNEGQRGTGVAVIRTDEQLAGYLSRAQGDTIIQEYVAGEEFGVFYYRHPAHARGHIFSITEKRFPVVTGDGTTTLERLILADERAVALARTYFELHRAHLWDVPAPGESVQLVELGTHCRGAVFLDGAWVKTDELAAAIDRLSRGYAGFYFGRFDIRTPAVADFRRGRNFKVVELNGVTSEATHIYDPRHSLFNAYRTLCAQWRIAFEIGAANHARGAMPTPLSVLLRLLLTSAKQTEQQNTVAQTTAGQMSCPAPDLNM